MLKQRGIQSYFHSLSGRVDEGGVPPSKKLKISNVLPSEVEKTIVEMPKLVQFSKQLKVLDPQMGESWFYALEKEFEKPYFKKLDEFVLNDRNSHTIYPKPEDVWSWTKHCRLKNVKVVIIGQDPYHNPGQAHGLCFSVQRGVKPPPSLTNIFKELVNDIATFKQPNHGDLTKWAQQGVLLLNACLTVREHHPNSHANKGWEQITDAVIKAVSTTNSAVIFLLWGAYAQKKAVCVDKKKHFLLNAPHPSPLSASRGFFGCQHFSKCNQLLEEAGKSPIDWCLD